MLYKILEQFSGKFSFLELGKGVDGRSDELAKARFGIEIQSVDTEVNSNPTHLMTTDEFFEQNLDEFDVIYIDACHKALQVAKDFNNAIKVISKGGLIFCHDLVPPTWARTGIGDCDIAYLVYLNLAKSNNIYTYLSDWGLTVVFGNMVSLEMNFKKHCRETYKKICEEAKIHSLSEENFIRKINELWVKEHGAYKG